MNKKLGRNDPCWCGSGLKYKKCHMGREKQAPLKPSEVDKQFRKAFSTKECLAPESMKADCSNTIVKAHTVPKSGSLQSIARNGHVYSYIFGPLDLIKQGGRIRPELLGINKASTFTGFCSVHDNAIFSKIEDQSFKASQEQCFLLAYRALARELYGKNSQVSSSSFLQQADRGITPEQQLIYQAKYISFNTGASQGLRDIEYHKSLFDKILIGADFRNIRAYIIELEFPPPIMCSSGTFPEQDFDGNQLQDLLDLKTTPCLLNFASFHGGDRGVIVFTWLPESDLACRPFINSLMSLPIDRVVDGLIRFFFEFTENLHIQPDWWENLAVDRKEALINRASASCDSEAARKPGCITDDGIRFDNWQITGFKAIGF